MTDRVSVPAIYRWKKQYARLESDQMRELQVLQGEHARLKRLVADLILDKAILQDIDSRIATRELSDPRAADPKVGVPRNSQARTLDLPTAVVQPMATARIAAGRTDSHRHLGRTISHLSSTSKNDRPIARNQRPSRQ